MSELELREFRTRAEELVELPDLAKLEGRGRRLRRRRLAAGAGAALVVGVLAAAGIVVVQRDDPDVAPVEPPDGRSGDISYPGAVQETLDPGTYVLQPSQESGAPSVRLTLPEGWNAWHGPNRFEDDPETTGWYAGLLVVDVTAVASRPCSDPMAGDEIDGSPAALVAAINRIPRLRVTAEPAPVDLFGYPATHLRVRPTRTFCDDYNLFDTERNGVVIGGAETLADTWVVNVDGDAILVDVGYTPKTPPEIKRELYAIVDSIEFVEPE